MRGEVQAMGGHSRAESLILLCRSEYEINKMRCYVQKFVDKNKVDIPLQSAFFTLSADCLRYIEAIQLFESQLAASEQAAELQCAALRYCGNCKHSNNLHPLTGICRHCENYLEWEIRAGVDLENGATILLARLQRYEAALHQCVDAINSIGTHYGTNLQVHGWHQNGNGEPLDNFFEANGLLEARDTAQEALKEGQ